MLRPLVDTLTKITSLDALVTLVTLGALDALVNLDALATLFALATSPLELNLPRLNLLQGLAASVGSNNSLDEKGQQWEDKHRGDDDHQGNGDGSVSATHVVVLLGLFLVATDAEAEAGHVGGEIIHVV